MTRREGHVARAAMVNRCGAPAKGESPVQAASVGTRAAERGEGNIENDNEEEGDEEAVKAMADAGHNVLIVTAPDPSFYAQCSQEKYNWVEKHLGAEWKSKVVLTRDKTTVRGDFLIDDKPTCDVGSMKPEWQHVVFDQTHNRVKAGAKRLTSWSAWKDIHFAWEMTVKGGCQEGQPWK